MVAPKEEYRMLGDGDVAIIRVNDRLTQEHVDRIKSVIGETLGVPVLVLDAGFGDLTFISKPAVFE
jgi:hypothetical protein